MGSNSPPPHLASFPRYGGLLVQFSPSTGGARHLLRVNPIFWMGKFGLKNFPSSSNAMHVWHRPETVRRGRTPDNETQWRWPRGRPRHAWMQQLEADTGLRPTAYNLYNIASERHAYRAVVGGSVSEWAKDVGVITSVTDRQTDRDDWTDGQTCCHFSGTTKEHAVTEGHVLKQQQKQAVMVPKSVFH